MTSTAPCFVLAVTLAILALLALGIWYATKGDDPERPDGGGQVARPPGSESPIDDEEPPR